jgi:hypothetical protein
LDGHCPLDGVRLVEDGNFDSDSHNGLLLLPDPEPDLLVILEAFIAPDRKHILIKVVELGVRAKSDDSE